MPRRRLTHLRTGLGAQLPPGARLPMAELHRPPAYQTVRFRRERRKLDRSAPAVSLLKPLCGLEPGLYENLRSHFQLDYPAVQIVFGVRDAGDPALRVAERLRVEFPDADVALVVDPGSTAPIRN